MWASSCVQESAASPWFAGPGATLEGATRAGGSPALQPHCQWLSSTRKATNVEWAWKQVIEPEGKWEGRRKSPWRQGAEGEAAEICTWSHRTPLEHCFSVAAWLPGLWSPTSQTTQVRTLARLCVHTIHILTVWLHMRAQLSRWLYVGLFFGCWDTMALAAFILCMKILCLSKYFFLAMFKSKRISNISYWMSQWSWRRKPN